jgi:hypothetical protein
LVSAETASEHASGLDRSAARPCSGLPLSSWIVTMYYNVFLDKISSVAERLVVKDR